MGERRQGRPSIPMGCEPACCIWPPLRLPECAASTDPYVSFARFRSCLTARKGAGCGSSGWMCTVTSAKSRSLSMGRSGPVGGSVRPRLPLPGSLTAWPPTTSQPDRSKDDRGLDLRSAGGRRPRPGRGRARACAGMPPRGAGSSEAAAPAIGHHAPPDRPGRTKAPAPSTAGYAPLNQYAEAYIGASMGDAGSQSGCSH